VTKVLGYDLANLQTGIDCGDLTSSNRMQFLVELEVAAVHQRSSAPTEVAHPVLAYTLQYSPVAPELEASYPSRFGVGSESKPVVIKGCAVVRLTNDPDTAAQRFPKVTLALTLHEVARAIGDVGSALSDADVASARSKLQYCIAVLERQLPNDTEGLAEVMLGRARRMLRRLERDRDEVSQGLAKEIRKAHHYAKLGRCLSMDQYTRDFSPSAAAAKGNRARFSRFFSCPGMSVASDTSPLGKLPAAPRSPRNPLDTDTDGLTLKGLPLLRGRGPSGECSPYISDSESIDSPTGKASVLSSSDASFRRSVSLN
jgi:hypothetical protein